MKGKKVMELDEAIKYYNDKAEDLEQECRQLAEWLTELKRLQGMGSHLDGYETEGYVFSYYESKDLIRITIYDVRTIEYFVEHIDLSSTLSHDEFVKWCNDYLNKENVDEN